MADGSRFNSCLVHHPIMGTKKNKVRENMSDFDLDEMFEEADKVQDFQFLGVSDCVLAFAEFGTCNKKGEGVKFQAEFVVVECATSEHRVGTVVSTRFKPYESKYENHRAKEGKRMMQLVQALYDLRSPAEASATCKKMLDASQPARGMLVRSGGYLGKQPMKKLEDGTYSTTEKAKDDKGNDKKPWPNVEYTTYETNTLENIAAKRAEIEKIQKFKPAKGAPPTKTKEELELEALTR